MQTINSKDLLRDCYGLARQQKKGSCWLDSTLEIFLNADTIGELVRSEVFEYGLYNDKIVPYKVKPEIIKDNDYQSFLIYIIFNFILFNLEITNTPDFITLKEDKIKIKRRDSFKRCENSLEKFMSIIKHILYKKRTFKTVNKTLDGQMKPIPDEKLTPGGFPLELTHVLFKYIPHIDSYINTKKYEYPEMFSIKLFEPNVFIGASISFKDIKSDDRHATSIIKCSDKIFYYDNNAPINIKTQKRNIDLGEHIIKKSKKQITGLDLFWQIGLGYIKHYCDYFTNPGHFIYKEEMPKKASDLLEEIIIFNKINDYEKSINVDIIEGPTLKNILIEHYLKNVNEIINIKFSDEYKDVLNKINIEFCNYLNITQTIPTQDATLYKYLKYKHKYLSLLKNSNIL